MAFDMNQEAAKYSEFIAKKAEQHAMLKDRSLDRRVVLQAARDFQFLDSLTERIKEVVKLPKADSNHKVLKPKTSAKRLLTLLWSDWHVGSDMRRPYESYQYGAVEEARRIARLCEQAATYKAQYRKDTDLRINLIGDIIEGHLHDPRSGADLDKQVARAFHHITQALAFLSKQFSNIVVECQRGNHGRRKERHPGHATSGKSDSIEDALYQCLQIHCRAHLKNVSFSIRPNAYSTYQTFGHECMTTHGDTILSPGNVGNNIPVAKLTQSTNAWNARPGHKAIKLFTVGHVHFPAQMHLPNGCVVFTNGALVPPNGYAESLGIPASTCGQWMWESTPEHVVGDSRLVVVGQNTDDDKSLDKIILPWKE